jgi:hypothetical protein
LLLCHLEDFIEESLLACVGRTLGKETGQCLESAFLKLLNTEAQLMNVLMLLFGRLCDEIEDMIEKVNSL